MKSTMVVRVVLASMVVLAGCDPARPTAPRDASGGGADAFVGNDGGGGNVDSGGGGVDGGVDAFVVVTPDAAVEIDSATPDSGVSTSWDNCRDAVVFGAENEACAFAGSCVECVLTVSPRQALCMGGRLRVTAAGAGACASTPDGGIVTFPDSGPRPDGGGSDAGASCAPLVVATPTAGVCSPSTVACIRDTGDTAACVTADATCLDCVQRDIQACATQTGGCDDEAGLANCCFETNCPDASCAGTTCAAPWDAYVACVNTSTCTVSDHCFPSAPTCPPATWGAPTMQGCNMATLTCLTAATTGAAAQACLDADTSSSPAGESCNTCVNDGFLSCATANGCDDELGDVACCLDTACPAGSPTTCTNTALDTGGACATGWNGFIACVNVTLSETGPCGYDPICFP